MQDLSTNNMYVIIASVIGIVAVIVGVYLTYVTRAYRRENAGLLKVIKSLKVEFEKKMISCKKLCDKTDDEMLTWQRTQDEKISNNSNLIHEIKGIIRNRGIK